LRGSVPQPANSRPMQATATHHQADRGFPLRKAVDEAGDPIAA